MDQPATPAPADTPAAVVKEIEHSSFIETFRVREGKQKFDVAANAVANKAMAQVQVSKLRVLMERAMKPYFDNPEFCPDSKSLKALVDAADVIEDLAARAYGDSKGSKNGNMLERLVLAATKGAVQGATTPSSNSFEAKLAKLRQVGQQKPTKAGELEVVE
jgi:hypothetical protein